MIPGFPNESRGKKKNVLCNTVDDCHDDPGDAIDDGGEGSSDGAEDGLDLCGG